MCGRYTLTAVDEQLTREFDLAIDASWPLPRYNIAPTQTAPVVRVADDGATRRLALHRWGLIPFWAKDESIGHRTINARSEEAANKPSFREAMRRRRCLVPCTGFYEWKAAETIADKTPSGRGGTKSGRGKGAKKQPYYIRRNDECVFTLAGLWERWRSPGGESIDSYTILTTAPNWLIAPLHDRMPVILDRADYDLWLDTRVQDVAGVLPLLQPFPVDDLVAYPVGLGVNSPSNDNPLCIQELPRR